MNYVNEKEFQLDFFLNSPAKHMVQQGSNSGTRKVDSDNICITEFTTWRLCIRQNNRHELHCVLWDWREELVLLLSTMALEPGSDLNSASLLRSFTVKFVKCTVESLFLSPALFFFFLAIHECIRIFLYKIDNSSLSLFETAHSKPPLVHQIIVMQHKELQC